MSVTKRQSCENCKQDRKACGNDDHYGFCQNFEYSEQESCNDAVSRQAVLDLMQGLTRWYVRSGDGKFNNVGVLYDDVIFGIDKLPSVTQEPKTGRWIRITNGAMKEKYICSECGRQVEDDGIEILLSIKYPYCQCGAKMVEPHRSEDKEAEA